jgi:choline dehydrogenase-like flavoprotein
VLKIYRRIEDWHGVPDPDYRGTGGPVFVQPPPDPNPIAPAMVEGARSVGIPSFENPNGRMMEGAGGASLTDVRVRDGYRQSVFRSYVFAYLDQPNLTVLTGALVTRVRFDRTRATGVEFSYDGTIHRVGAGSELVLSLGAIHTPKVLMQSGIGDRAELQRAVDAADSPGISANSRPIMSCLIIMSLPSNCGCPSRIAKSLSIEIDLLNSCRAVRRADLAGIGSGNWGFSRVGSRSCAEPFRVWCRFLL